MRLKLFSSLLALAAIAAGCGSSSSSSSPSSGSSAGSSNTSGSAYGAPAASSSTPSSSASSAATATPIMISSKHAKLGTILAAGPKRLSVYLFESDKRGSSSCSGACAKVWPPVTGKATVQGAARSADLGTITRSDGSTQVTYKGQPLYYYAKDKDAGDAYGAGIKSFGAKWYVLMPNGKKIDNA